MIICRCDEIKKYFTPGKGFLGKETMLIKAVDGVSLEIGRGETFGLVGESGSGKTTLGRIILGILKQDSGQIALEAKGVQAIFQDPYNSLDPKMRVRDILSEPLVLKGAGGDIDRRLREVLELIRLPADSLGKYPHEFSGGQRQRIAIGRAVATAPEFIVCDEPVSNLDVTIQLQVLNLLKDIQKKLSATYLLISHDLRVVRFMSDRLAVMREGKIVEQGPTQAVYSNPTHPYTKLLLSSVLDVCP